MIYLFWIIAIGVIGYLIGKIGRQAKSKVDQQLAQQNRNWYLYIKSFNILLKEKSHKKLIDDILKDVKKQGLVDGDFDGRVEYSDGKAPTWVSTEAAGDNVEEHLGLDRQVIVTESHAAQISSKPKIEIQLDNASLLLYLGAFIFVASIGLFVAFGRFDGTIKTFIVLLLAIAVYFSGVGLYTNTKKYTQVGVAFAAIGMAIVPFVGLAAYLYIFNQSNAPMVWLASSVLCVLVYIHALMLFRKPFLNYIFIFTLLSLFESSVSVINVPIYYFGWAMASLGIMLGYVATFKNIWPDFKNSAYASGQLFVPLSVVVSAAILPNQGSIQMSISLALATAFYGLQAFNSKDKLRENYLALTQVLGVGAILWLSYGLANNLKITAFTALTINALQLIVLLMAPRVSSIWYNFGTILVGTSIIGIMLSLQSPVILLSAVCLLMLVGSAVWLKQDRLEGYAIATGSLMAAPVILGQLVINSNVSAFAQSGLLLAALLIQWIVYARYRMTSRAAIWQPIAQQVFVLSLAVVGLSGLLASPLVCLLVCAVATLLTISLAYLDKNQNWAIVAGIIISIPVARSLVNSHDLLLCVTAALTFNIAAALKYRQEFNRWLGSGLWFIVPIALGNGVLGSEWTTDYYAYAFMLVAVGFIVARAIARGVWLVSGKVPLASYSKSASLSYIVGYSVAIITSIGLSLLTSDSQVLTTALLSITFVLVLLIAKYIEKEPELISIAPVLAQAVLLSALRPAVEDTSLVTFFVLTSSALAAIFYGGVCRLYPKNMHKNLGMISLLLLFFAPISVLYFGSIWAMPVSLMFASMILYYHYMDASQIEHEAIGGIFTTGILWLMYQFGIRDVQAFTHVVVALLAIYAVWRTKRGETDASNQYILAVLITATVPLILQALGGSAGGLYGWWLLLEQIAFIVIGMFVGSKLMIQWGLYVAVAAILYQLRGLGWAALAFLGIFVIALAAYQIQRINKN